MMERGPRGRGSGWPKPRGTAMEEEIRERNSSRNGPGEAALRLEPGRSPEEGRRQQGAAKGEHDAEPFLRTGVRPPPPVLPGIYRSHRRPPRKGFVDLTLNSGGAAAPEGTQVSVRREDTQGTGNRARLW